MPEAFAKTKKATNILRPAIDVSFLATYEVFLATALSALKKKKEKNFFHHLNCRLHIVSNKLWMNILDYHIPLGLNLEGDTHIYCNQIYYHTLLSPADVSICCYPKS